MEHRQISEAVSAILSSAFQPDKQGQFQQELMREGGRVFVRGLRQLNTKDSKELSKASVPVSFLQEMAWEKLHTGNWKDVPLVWRDAYTLSCLLAAAAKLQNQQSTDQDDIIASAMKELDMAVLMGGPKFRKHADNAIAAIQDATGQLPLQTMESEANPAKRQKIDSRSGTSVQLPPGSFEWPGEKLREIGPPSMECFWTEHMQPEAAVVITGAIAHWPAMQRWQDLDYFLKVAGSRTVPVEVGAHYLADGWGQQLMLLSDFLTKHIRSKVLQLDPAKGRELAPNKAATTILKSCCAEGAAKLYPDPSKHMKDFQNGSSSKGDGYQLDSEKQENMQVPKWEDAVGKRVYLAQHPLFDQIPELRRDIDEPIYCCLGEGELQVINAWFGPAGTVTPLHYDPHHNLLAQVVGSKYVRLYPASASQHLAPFESGHNTNSSQVDLDQPDFEKYPYLRSVPFKECILKPGQMLYIPPKHWHYVKSLEVSFSVTFWWK